MVKRNAWKRRSYFYLRNYKVEWTKSLPFGWYVSSRIKAYRTVSPNEWAFPWEEPWTKRCKHYSNHNNTTNGKVFKEEMYLFMDFQSLYENGWMCLKNTADPTPATLTKLCATELWPFPLLLSMKTLPVWLLPEKKQRGRSWCWAWSQSIASIRCSIGTFDHKRRRISYGFV